MNVALVYDRVNKWGGAERVLLALHKLWPDAPLYTAVYDKKRAAWADVFTLHPSFLQHIPGAKRMHEALAILTPMAFEIFDFSPYDVVISVTSAEAKYVITKPETVHICYCLTPTRYLWSGYSQYRNRPGLGMMSWPAKFMLRTFGPMLQQWDLVGASRPDYYIAISNRVKERIQTYYHREVADVIYPPVDIKKFTVHPSWFTQKKTNGYFLTVSRLVSYKRVDILIQAFNKLGLSLVVIGDGHEKRRLQHMAKKNVTFVDRHLTDSELVGYYGECRAFVYAADEDFGIAVAEAQASGVPVIAYRDSGVSEIVKENVSGVLFEQQTADALIQAVRTFETKTFSPDACRAQVLDMSSKVFARKMAVLVDRLVKEAKQ